MDNTIETSKVITNDAGTVRLQVVADPEGTGNPREDYDCLGVLVAHYHGYALPHEGDRPNTITDKLRESDVGFRVVSRWLRMSHGASVVLPIFSSGGNELRLSAGTVDDDADADGAAIGVIYDTPETRKGLREGVAPEQIAAWLRTEVDQYTVWACGEMTAWEVQRLVGDPEQDEAWEPVESVSGYYSTEEAREVGLPELERVAEEALAAHIEELHAQALVENARAQLAPWADAANGKAAFFPMMTDDENPEVTVAGVAVSVYVEDTGTLRVSVHTDTGDVDPPLMRGEGDGARVALVVTINGHAVFEDA